MNLVSVSGPLAVGVLGRKAVVGGCLLALAAAAEAQTIHHGPTPAFAAPPGAPSSAHTQAPDYFGIGQGWGDLDGDNCPELYVTSGGGANTLWRNGCDGTFDDVTPSALAFTDRESAGVAFADYDNDGDLDVYVLHRGANSLLRNDGNWVFLDVTATAGVGDPGQGETAAWGDYDEDGDLDLYVVNWYFEYDENSPLNRDGFYRNDGDGTFTDVSSWFDTPTLERPGFAASFVDYDNDGDLDLYVVNDKTQGNPLWRNNGAGCGGWCFEDVSVATGADRPAWAMGIAIGDYDNDGDLDFYYSSIAEAVLLENQWSQGNHAFIERSIAAGVSPNATSWGTVFFDYDNDGLLDLYLATFNEDPGRTNRLYRNLGDGTFADVSDASGCDDNRMSMGVAAGDYDGDGWVDLAVGNWGDGFELYRNQLGDGPASEGGGQWLRVRVEGGGPIDRDGLGTRVTLRTDDGRTQLRELRSGSSIGAGEEMVLHFGLGGASITGLDVLWLDGTAESLPIPAPNQVLDIRHPRAGEIFLDGFETGDTSRWFASVQ
ncbi:MAG: CRTAC1 family protein [Acidobacteriota bacterium]